MATEIKNITQFARKALGKNFFSILRFYGYQMVQKFTPSFTVESFSKFLVDEMKLERGDTIFVHSSTFKMNISFPPNKIIDILLDVAGEEGTLLFPCWHFNYRAEEYLKDSENVFKVKRSPTVMGLLPELVRRNKASFRSLSPINSVVGIGRNAEELVRDHHKSMLSSDKNSPFYKVVDYKGKTIGLGELPEDSFSFVHCVEDVLKDKFPFKTRVGKIYNGRVIDAQKNEILVPVIPPSEEIGKRDVKTYLDKHVADLECKTFKKNGTNFYVSDAVLMYKKMEELALKNITIYNPLLRVYFKGTGLHFDVIPIFEWCRDFTWVFINKLQNVSCDSSRNIRDWNIVR